MEQWSKVYILIFVSLFLIIGCQDVADELVGKKPEGAKTINITMVAKSSVNPVFLSARIGAESAAKELSEKYSMIDVNIEWRTPKFESPYGQEEKIIAAIKDGTDAIIVSCSDDSILTSVRLGLTSTSSTWLDTSDHLSVISSTCSRSSDSSSS